MSDQEKLSPEIEQEIEESRRMIMLGVISIAEALRAQRLTGRKDFLAETEDEIASCRAEIAALRAAVKQ